MLPQWDPVVTVCRSGVRRMCLKASGTVYCKYSRVRIRMHGEDHGSPSSSIQSYASMVRSTYDCVGVLFCYVLYSILYTVRTTENLTADELVLCSPYTVQFGLSGVSVW